MSQEYGDPRDYKDRLVDRLLLLHLFDRVSETSRITGDVKLQKLVFLSENSLVQEGIDGLKYSFFRWEHGPMSKEVYEDHEYLCENRFVSEESGEILSQGKEVLDQATPVLSDNSDIVREINLTIEKYGDIPGYKLKNIVYDMNVELMASGTEQKVEDIPKGTDIIWSLSNDEYNQRFELSDEWAETLDILLHERSRKSVNTAVEEARKEPSSSFSIDV
ncbi:type II toxin-antitoxin system antitoxin SocA domain-containing protein [Halovivax asiaticus]|uniref:type II toxin-antitoxin system antitoxin SocA domain-containing protein n=1 Tax=Halovivax asiaticus TaxID=332953 RepID=UPI0012674AA8|nr:type II toxin-antitoxin system antitoxin SocA domain-containing protein [Halovivax asiaticus]